MKYIATVVVEFQDSPPLVCGVSSDTTLDHERIYKMLWDTYRVDHNTCCVFVFWDNIEQIQL